MTSSPALDAFLDTQPGRCRTCRWHEVNQGHAPDCTEGRRRASEAMHSTADAHPGDVGIVDRILDHFIALGKPFSLNDLRPHLRQVGERSVIGSRVNTASRSGRIEHIGYVRSTDPRTKGHEIKVWRPVS